MSKQVETPAERRAIAARLSLCLLASVAFLAAILAAPALAEVRAPLLTGTEPDSSPSAPAQTTTPLIVGEAEPEVITQVVKSPFGRAAAPLAAGSKNPEYEIKIFTGSGCQGEPTATGLAYELEEPGIQVAAAENATTEFSAKQVDPSEPAKPSKCSAVLKYWEGNPPPEEEPPVSENPGGGGSPGGSPPPSPARPAPPLAPRLHTSPLSPANDNAPRLVGSAPGADAVKLFANSSCSGVPVAMVSPAELAAGVVMHVPDNSTTDFTGISAGNGKQSFCSPPATYIEDSMAPRTRITMGPGAKTRRHKAVFRFADTSGDPAAVEFKCKVDHGKWKPCNSPLKLRHLGFHRYVLRVRGTDAIGNAETKPARRSFKVIH